MFMWCKSVALLTAAGTGLHHAQATANTGADADLPGGDIFVYRQLSPPTFGSDPWLQLQIPLFIG